MKTARLRFIGVFALLLAIYYTLVLLPAGERVLFGYLEANARASAWVLNRLHQSVSVTGTTLRSGAFAIAVRRGCDALEPAWFFCAAVLAYPAPFRRKWKVLPWGAGGILSLNLVRIVSLFWIGRRSPHWFPVAHLEVWPAIFMVLALALWMGWVRSCA